MNTQPDSQTETETTERPAWAGVLAVILKIAAIVGVVLFALAIVGVTAAGLAAAWAAIHHLGGTHFRLAYPVPEIVATATLCTLVVTGAYLAYFGPTTRNVARATALLVFIAWIALLVVLAILDMALTAGVLKLAQTAGQVTNASQVSNVTGAWQIAIPPEVTETAKVIYAALAPLPVAAGLVLAVVHWSDTGVHGSINHGGAAVGWFIVKLFMASAMFLAEAFFGYYATQNALLAIFAGLLNAVVFTAVLNAIAAAKKEGQSSGIMGFLALVYAGIMAAIGYEVWLAFGGDKLAFAPKPALLRTVAETAFMSSIGLSAFVLVIMRLTTPATVSDHANTNIRRPDPLASRIAGGIRGTRSGLAEIRAAARGNPVAALPQPARAVSATTTMGSDMDATTEPVVQTAEELPAGAGADAAGAVRDPKRKRK
jgi:hypothetical protein